MKSKVWSIFLICGLLCLPAARGLSAVVVFDGVTTVGTPVYLKVLTKGRIFAAGGKRVEFFLDDERLGKNLTGGDGYGYRKYAPRRAGIIKVRVLSNGESGSGLLLVMKKSDKAVLIEVEGAFKDAFISEIAAGASRRAMEKMMQNYQIIYLSRYSGLQMSRNWLDEKDFPQAPVLPWQGPKLLSALKEKGIHLHAIIGSAGIIGEAAEHIEKRYTFGQTQKGQTVKDWEEVIDLLEKSAPGKSAKNKDK